MVNETIGIPVWSFALALVYIITGQFYLSYKIGKMLNERKRGKINPLGGKTK